MQPSRLRSDPIQSPKPDGPSFGQHGEPMLCLGFPARTALRLSLKPPGCSTDFLPVGPTQAGRLFCGLLTLLILVVNTTITGRAQNVQLPLQGSLPLSGLPPLQRGRLE